MGVATYVTSDFCPRRRPSLPVCLVSDVVRPAGNRARQRSGLVSDDLSPTGLSRDAKGSARVCVCCLVFSPTCTQCLTVDMRRLIHHCLRNVSRMPVVVRTTLLLMWL